MLPRLISSTHHTEPPENASILFLEALFYNPCPLVDSVNPGNIPSSNHANSDLLTHPRVFQMTV